MIDAIITQTNIQTNINITRNEIYSNSITNTLHNKYNAIVELYYTNTKENKIFLSNNKCILKKQIEELQQIKMSNVLKSKIKEYNKNMNTLLTIYNNGKNNNIFKENNFSLYSDIQYQLTIIIDMKYDIIENITKTQNDKQIITKLDILINEHKKIINDINKTIIPDINI